MKNFRLLIWSAAICGAAVFTGCVDTAANQLSPMEQEWERAIRTSYPGYRTPKTMPPAVRDSVVYYEAPKAAVKTADIPAASDDPAAAVDNAAANISKEAVPVPVETAKTELPKAEAPADAKPAEEKPAEVKKDAAPAEEKKAETPAEVKKEAAPAEEKKAETPAEVKKEAAKENKGNAEAIVKAGDTIGGIAKEFYGNAKYADVILKANPQVKNANRLKIGTKLVIPAL